MVSDWIAERVTKEVAGRCLRPLPHCQRGQQVMTVNLGRLVHKSINKGKSQALRFCPACYRSKQPRVTLAQGLVDRAPGVLCRGCHIYCGQSPGAVYGPCNAFSEPLRCFGTEWLAAERK